MKVHGADSLGQPFSQTASVVDVSESGVRLEGVHILNRSGQVAVLEYNGTRAQFRVVWVGGGALAGQAGLMNLEPEKPIFNLRFPPPSPDKYVEPPSQHQTFDDGLRRLVEKRRQEEKRTEERRRYPRFPCRGDAEIYVSSSEFPERGKVTDLSRGGCFVELLPSIRLDTRVKVILLIAQRKIRVQGVVRSVLQNFGLGVQFLHLETEDLQRLEEILAALEQGTPINAVPQPAAATGEPRNGGKTDPQRALELVKGWFGEHDFLTRQEFHLLLKKGGD